MTDVPTTSQIVSLNSDTHYASPTLENGNSTNRAHIQRRHRQGNIGNHYKTQIRPNPWTWLLNPHEPCASGDRSSLCSATQGDVLSVPNEPKLQHPIRHRPTPPNTSPQRAPYPVQ